jgi:hypothetical protein
MSEPLAVEDTLFTVFERRAKHHHDNTGTELPDTNFTLLLSVLPEKLGVRIRIVDEYRDGTATVDVAVQYHWDRDVTLDDNLNDFVERTAIPQVLACASAMLIETANTITDAQVPFYGLSALNGMVENFRNRKRTLSEILEASIARRASEEQEQSTE